MLDLESNFGVRYSVSRKEGKTLDQHIGDRLRKLRQRLNLTLENVGEILDVSQQQVSRFELGQQRLSASQIYCLARGLNVPVSWFFREFPENGLEIARPRHLISENKTPWRVDSDKDMEVELLNMWRSLNTRQQEALITLLESFTHFAKAK